MAMQQATHRMLPDGRRLHLQHGPIDLIVEAFGEVTPNTMKGVRVVYIGDTANSGRVKAAVEPATVTLPVIVLTAHTSFVRSSPALSSPIRRSLMSNPTTL